MRPVSRIDRIVPVVLAASLLAACGASVSTTPSTDPRAEWRAFRERRHASLTGEDGWLTLIGLHWMDEGEITLGSDPGAGIVLPADRAPARLGRIVVAGGAARFVPEADAQVTSADAPVTTELALVPDVPGPPTVLAVGSLRMHVIARAGRLGLRVKDRASPAREAFPGIPTFDYDPAFRVRARFERAEGETLPIVNVLGQQVDEPLAGRLRFELAGASVTLLATWDGDAPEDGLAVMFRDATSDEGETYGAGRYLEVAAPDPSGETWIDFNLAYTPPCGFTEFATCPLPPPENEIPVPVRAGERAPAGH